MSSPKPSPPPHSAGLGPPRFRLRSLLGTTAMLCVVLASYTWFGPSGAMLFGLFALAVLAHVTGNWLGNQLRDIGDHHQRHVHDRPAHVTSRMMPVEEHHFAPTTSLRRHRHFSRTTKLTILGGAFLFGFGGAAGLAVLHWHRTTWTSLALSTLALMALGGMFTFLCISFIQAGWHALHEATKEVKR